MRWLAGLGLLGVVLLPASASAATLEPVGNFTSPTFITSYPDDEDRLLVVERAGTVQLVDGGTTSTFLDASSLVGTIEGERGMWSIALAPDFGSTGRLYAFYAGSATGGDLQLDEFTAAGDSVDLATRRPVLSIEHPRLNHNGGQLQFGPDGYLYMSTGDGDRPSINAQHLDVLLGKILRIDPRQSGGAPYSVPPDNPFVGIDGEDEIWSYGLRNPYRFSFDRLNGALAIGDVGRQRFEEVDYDPGPQPGRGDNYGWPCFEGNHVQNTKDPPCPTIDPDATVFPIHEYAHADGGPCSITGGYVARDPSLGSLFGRYLYADFCAGQIRSLVPGVPQASGDRSESLAVNRPVSFGEDACGRLYVASLTGPVSRLVGDDPSDCGEGEVAVVDGVLTVSAVAGVRNQIEVTPSGSNAEWVVRDHSAPLVASAGCTQLRPSRVRCPKVGVTSLAVGSGLLNDRVTTPDGLDASVHAGGGDDQVTTGDGMDSLAGGTGRDVLDGGAGADLVDGGLNRDVVLYKARGAAEPVDVSLDGASNDGGLFDDGQDNVLASVENIQGGAGADTLTGSAGENALTGGPGTDELHGLGGNDEIRARDGGTVDTINCGAGPADHVFTDPSDVFPPAGPDACELVN